MKIQNLNKFHYTVHLELLCTVILSVVSVCLQWSLDETPPASSAMSKLTFGLLLDSDHSNSVLEKGPVANCPEVRREISKWAIDLGTKIYLQLYLRTQILYLMLIFDVADQLDTKNCHLFVGIWVNIHMSNFWSVTLYPMKYNRN